VKQDKPKRSLTLAVAAAIACVLQIIALTRYVRRLPDDWVGIVLYVVTTVAFALAAFGFFFQWKKGKSRGAQRQ